MDQAEGYWGNTQLSTVVDPFVPGGNPPLQVVYAAGTYGGGGTSGAGWYSPVAGHTDAATLSYKVAFQPGFNWVKGGKVRRSTPASQRHMFDTCSCRDCGAGHTTALA